MGPELLVYAAMAAVGFLVLVGIMKQFIIIARPNQRLILSGRKRALTDGSGGEVGYRPVGQDGWKLRIPLIERVDVLDMRNIPIDIRITNAYSEGGIPLNVHAIANVKVAEEPELMNNAIERFLGRDVSELRQVAKETLEGHVRGVLATLTPEEVNEDRLKFAHALIDEAGEDLAKLGLHLDTLKIQAVDDNVNYLASIGRQSIAAVLRDAEVAESNAKASAEEAEAGSDRAGQVADEEAEAAILQKKNEVRRIRAELEARAKSEEETTTQAALEARAQAEQELQLIREQVEKMRLVADVVLPAEASKQAAGYTAQGAAANIEESGRAAAEVLQMMTDAWVKAGDDAKDIFLIQNLEKVLKSVVDRVNSVKVDEVNLLDNGDGTSLAAYVSSYPSMVNQVLRELRDTTGVDVVGILTPDNIKR